MGCRRSVVLRLQGPSLSNRRADAGAGRIEAYEREELVRLRELKVDTELKGQNEKSPSE